MPIESLHPNAGSAGTHITLTGSGFTGVTAVLFGQASSPSFTIESDTQISALVPGGAAGTTVAVCAGPGADGALMESPVPFTYQLPQEADILIHQPPAPQEADILIHEK